MFFETLIVVARADLALWWGTPPSISGTLEVWQCNPMIMNQASRAGAMTCLVQSVQCAKQAKPAGMRGCACAATHSKRGQDSPAPASPIPSAEGHGQGVPN